MFDVVVNVGGFGQTEEQLVLQSRVRINAGLTLLALGVYTQLALVLKKKQFERLRLATWIALDMSPTMIGHRCLLRGCMPLRIPRVELECYDDLQLGIDVPEAPFE